MPKDRPQQDNQSVSENPPQAVEREKIEEVFKMYGLERLLYEDPRVQRAMAESEAKGEAKGQLEGLRSSVEMAVSARFPSLTDLAHQKVSSLVHPDALRTLVIQVATAPDEETARRLLLP